MRQFRQLAPLAVASGIMLVCGISAASEFRSTADAPTLMYDAPSAKARPLFVYGRDVPLEVIVSVEGWTKVRDAGGTIGWFATKNLTDKRVLVIRVPVADIRATPEDTGMVVFRAEQGVLLEPAENVSTPTATATPGWLKVRHRDGQSGYVRVTQVFGL